MTTNNHKIVDYDEILDKEFGAEGTIQRAQAEEQANDFYSMQEQQSPAKAHSTDK